MTFWTDPEKSFATESIAWGSWWSKAKNKDGRNKKTPHYFGSLKMQKELFFYKLSMDMLWSSKEVASAPVQDSKIINVAAVYK